MTSVRRGAALERSIHYTPAEQVREIASVSANQTIRFDYGPDRKRYQRREYNASATLLRTVRYLGNVEVIDVPLGLGVSEVKRYIGSALVITLRADGGGSKAYLYTDPQGSTDLVTDRFGNVGEYCRVSPPTGCRQFGQRQGFDAFGLRRRVESTPVWQVLPWADRQSFVSRATSRGYTGHEAVDAVGLVHMNGRMYDPLIGRFIQPDPIIQDPYDTQSHNRYSYVLNNPLSAVDPSGNLSVRQAVLTVAAIVVTYYTGVWAIGYLAEGAAGSAAMTAAAGGFVAGGLTTGTLKGALAGSFGSLATMGVGAAFTGVGQVLAQGAVGGVMSELQGGKFGHGFASAGMSAALNPAIAQGVQGGAGQLVAHAVLGGTVSVVAGGKFANGAVTAAFAYAFGSMARGGPSVAGSGAGSGIDANSVPSGDVLGTPAMDAQALQDAGPMSNTAAVESSLVRLRGGGTVSPIRCTNSECSYPATAFGAEFVVHAHVPSNYTGRVKNLIDQMRLLPSAGDHSFLVHANAPNYVKNLAGNVNVLEYTVSGGYQVRWLTGPSAGSVQSWSPAQMNETRAFREANRRR